MGLVSCDQRVAVNRSQDVEDIFLAALRIVLTDAFQGLNNSTRISKISRGKLYSLSEGLVRVMKINIHGKLDPRQRCIRRILLTLDPQLNRYPELRNEELENDFELGWTPMEQEMENLLRDYVTRESL